MIPVFQPQETVTVQFAGGAELEGTVERVRMSTDGKTEILVVFDDPQVFGGVGQGWFVPEQVTAR